MSEQSGGSSRNERRKPTGNHSYRRNVAWQDDIDQDFQSQTTIEQTDETSGFSRQYEENNYSYRHHNSHNSSRHPNQYGKQSSSRPQNYRIHHGYQNRNGRPHYYRNRCHNIESRQNLDSDYTPAYADNVSLKENLSSTNKRSNFDNHCSEKPLRHSQFKNESRTIGPHTSIVTNIIDQGNQAESLRHQIESNTYECMVCYETINAFCATYSCFQCFNIFHLVCIRQWASSKLGDENLSKDNVNGWTCPACQVTSTLLPARYICFCKAIINPEYKPFILPHSCGEKCSRSRKLCNHSCPELCHPGKCPPCLMSVVSYCLCGKDSKRVKCNMSSSSFSCENDCQKLLNCRKHTCQVICHEGSCKDCQQTNELVCYCGKSSKEIKCGSEIEYNFLDHKGFWACSEICGNSLVCNNHVCKERCHYGPCPPCKTDVSEINSCPCGKTKLDRLSQIKRESCLDIIPTCMKICKKVLDCGAPQKHICQSLCHNGPCPPCPDKTLVTCACGSSSEYFPCSKLSVSSLACEKVCYKKKNCGRHRCNTKCCLEDNHICMITCGKLLSCKGHKCEELCHRGHCMPCLMSNFDEVFCTCGRTKLEPPVACGTPPPSCQELCSLEHTCSHPVTHKCHYDDSCPPCPHLTNKVCMGGHKVRYNIPCHMSDVSCGELCQKQLPCKMHKCIKWCHKGECLAENSICELPCSDLRAACSHPCNNPCHPDQPCPSTICFFPVKLFCDCRRRSVELLCFEGSPKVTDNKNLGNFHVKLKSSGLTVSQTDLLDYLKGRYIQCDEKCKVEIRNQKLAEGLGLKDVPIDNVVTPLYTESLKRAVKENKEFIVETENTFTDLISKYKKRNESLDTFNKVKFIYHDLKTMNKEKRKIIHDLATFYNIETQSYDKEPQRNVQVRIAYNSSEPTVKLSQFFQKRVIGGVGSSSRLKVQEEPDLKSSEIPNLQALDLNSLPKNDIIFDNWEDIDD